MASSCFRPKPCSAASTPATRRLITSSAPTAPTHRPPADDFPWQELHSGASKMLISLGTVSRDRGARFYEVMMEALDNLVLTDSSLSRRPLQGGVAAPEALRDRA